MATTPTARPASGITDPSPDILDRVVRAHNVAWYEWTDGSDQLRVSPALAELFDLDPDNHTVQRLLEQIHPDDIAACSAARLVFLKSGEARATFTVRFIQRRGAVRWCLLHMLAERDTMGRVTRLTGTVTDITEAKAQEAENRAFAARQAASIEVLKAIAASPDDAQPVFDLIARRARDLCGAAAVSIVEYDGALMHLRVTEGFDQAAAEQYRRAHPRAPGPDSLFARALLANEVVHSRDFDAEPAILQAGRDVGTKSSLFVPLRRDGQAIGAIGLARFETGGFDDAQVALIESFAEQASLAIAGAATLRELRARTAELAERNSEYGERIEHQSATIDVLKAMSVFRDDARPVLDLIARRAWELCNANGVGLYQFDGTLVHLLAVHAHRAWSPEEQEAFRSRFPMVPAANSSFGRCIINQRMDHIRDVDKDPEISPTWLTRQVKSFLHLPLFRDNRLIGVLGINATEPGGFSDSQVALLKTFAEQAVIAIGGAETFRNLNQRTADLQESLEYQTATGDVLKVISRSTFDLQPVLDTLIQTAARLCDAEMAMIYRRDREGWRVAANFGYPPEFEAYWQQVGAFQIDPVSPTVGYRAAREGRTVHIHDVTAVPGYPEAFNSLSKQRTALGVPLLRESEVIGVIILGRQRVEPFTDRQTDLVSTFADQAVIAIENARLITEQKEALEQQTATAEVLQVINASPGNLAPVFEAMLERALRLCGAAFGALHTYDGERFEIVATKGVPAAFEAFRRRNQMPAGPDTPPGQAAITRRPVQVVDVLTHPFFVARPELQDAQINLGGIRAVLNLPLLKDEATVGMFVIYRKEPGVFPEKQIALLENFGAQAVIAMENARLLTEQREALEQQTATAEVLQVINASPGNLTPVFDAVLTRALRLCGADFGEFGAIEGETFTTAALAGMPPDFARLRTNVVHRPGPGTVGWRMLRGEDVVHIPDLKDEEAYRAGDPVRTVLVDVGGARALLSVALRKDTASLGFISLYRHEPGLFTDKQIALLQGFAAQAVIAMESARLLNELRSRTDELAQRQAELRVTFENMGDGVALFDATPRLLAWNREFQEIFAVPDALLEQHRTYADYIRYLAARGDFGPGADPDEQLRRFAETAGAYHTFERTRPDGRVIEIRHNPVAGGGFVLIFSDITERKRNEAEIRAARDAAEAASRTIEAAFRELKTAQANLIQAEKMASLGQLTAGIAHEIKNPLNFVNNFALLSVELLNELMETAAPAFAALVPAQRADIDEASAMLTSNLEKITEHGRRADGIVRSMLEHSRGASGERRVVALNALVDEALNLAFHGARAQDPRFNIALRRDFDAAIAPIELNPQDMTRVFLNLFSNGFHAANARARGGAEADFAPTLTVTTRDLGAAAEIRVRDNGTGIPEAVREKIFEPFFTTKPTGEGTGLGLSITYDIVTKQHGGTIAVDSEVDAFTEFVVTLPCGIFEKDVSPG